MVLHCQELNLFKSTSHRSTELWLHITIQHYTHISDVMSDHVSKHEYIHTFHSSDLYPNHKPRFIIRVLVWGISELKEELSGWDNERLATFNKFRVCCRTPKTWNWLPFHAESSARSEETWNWPRCIVTIITSVRDWQSTLNLDTTWMQHCTRYAILSTQQPQKQLLNHSIQSVC